MVPIFIFDGVTLQTSHILNEYITKIVYFFTLQATRDQIDDSIIHVIYFYCN